MQANCVKLLACSDPQAIHCLLWEIVAQHQQVLRLVQKAFLASGERGSSLHHGHSRGTGSLTGSLSSMPRLMPRDDHVTALGSARRDNACRPRPACLAAVLAAITSVAAVAQLMPGARKLAATLGREVVRLQTCRGGTAAVGVEGHEVLAAGKERAIVVSPAIHAPKGGRRVGAARRRRRLGSVDELPRFGGGRLGRCGLVAVAAWRELRGPIAARSLVEAPHPRVAAVLVGWIVR
mmetsp:Transcript_15918/g.35632  ORF Transcript_15918/g.35632 Transcript_15918/m.35632 type:complete len:236 (+) Transcript_15918:118-825(+)